MPEGVIVINQMGRIITMDEAPLGREQNLFNYVATMYDLKMLKNAIKKANNYAPQTIEISFMYIDKKIDYLCKIFFEDDKYLIGIWRIPKKILYLPHKETAV